MIAPVAIQVTGADGAIVAVKLPVETWLHGNSAVWLTTMPASARPVQVVIDPKHVYPDVERSNNSWTAPAGP
jgi:hypothetical protein